MDVNNNIWIKHILLALATATALSACMTDKGDKTSSSHNSSSSDAPVSQLVVQKDGYAELADGRGGVTYESIHYPTELGFDKAASLTAFKDTLYPLLRTNCSSCHNTENTSRSGAQAPLHADINPALAHEHALTQVNFHNVHESKLSTHLWIDRHNCFSISCAAAAKEMDLAISAWKSRIADTLPEPQRSIPADVKISEAEVEAWIAADKSKISAEDRAFIQYASFHVLHNEGVSAQDLNLARVGLSKALNSLARWAPKVTNPLDINEKGMVYRFDIRDYWGYTQIDTSDDYALFFGGSDDDLAFAPNGKVNTAGVRVSFNDLGKMKNTLRTAITKDEKYARLAWQRILYGNVEGSTDKSSSLPPNIKGFAGKRSDGPAGQEYIKAEDLEYVEAAQLTFTLTRPDVYNAIMAIPGYGHWLEDELGLDISAGVKSFDYMVQYEAISIDSRLYYRGKQSKGKNNYFWKAVDTYATQLKDIDEVYAAQEQNSPFWEGPVPVFIAAGGGGGTSPEKFTIIATRNLGPGGERGGGYYTGTDEGSVGGQQSYSSMIYSLPNGLQGYAVYGGFNQRRTDISTNVIRDPRLLREAGDNVLDNYAGYGFPKGSSGDTQLAGIRDLRLNTGSSCIGCHANGINRGNNDLRDWLEESPSRLPGGDHGVDKWINDPSYVAQVKELYKPSGKMRRVMEGDRSTFLETMGIIQKDMIIGPDKNVYQEPTIWLIEWARKYYGFPVTRST